MKENIFIKKQHIYLIDQLTQTFTQLNTKSRLDRCYSHISSLPDHAVKEIIDTMIDTFRNTPLPQDFANAARDWRSRYYKENNKWWSEKGPIDDKIEETQFKCTKCGDVGVVKITHKTPDNFKSLMRCDCGMLSENEVKIPEWDNALSGVYNKEYIPDSFFNPQINKEDDDIKINTKIMNKVYEFNRVKKSAEKHWSDAGFK